MRSLTPKQQRFCEEYVIDLDPFAAARRSGYTPGYGSQLLMKTNVREEIARLKSERSERTSINADDALREIALVAFSRMKRYVSWGPNGVTLVDSSQLEDGMDACVSEVSQTVTRDGGSIRFKLHDKMAALSMLSKHLGLLKEKSSLDELLAGLEPGIAEAIRRWIAQQVSEESDRECGEQD